MESTIYRQVVSISNKHRVTDQPKSPSPRRSSERHRPPPRKQERKQDARRSTTMARWKDVPDDAWQRIFGLLGYLDLARCLAVCRDWRRLGALPLLPSVLIPSAEQGLSSSFDISLREMGLLENAPGFHGRRVIGSFVGGRLAIAFTVANPTLYGVVDLSTGEVTQSLPDRLRIPNSAHLQSVAIMAITGGSGGVFAAIASGETNLIFWRVGMEAWCPPLAPEPVPLPGLDDDAHRFWRMILPTCAIDDVHYSDASDVFFVLTIRQDLWRYVPLRLQDGGLAFQRHLDIVGDDFSGVMAARYLFAGPDEALLMARRVLSPQHEEEGTSELEVFVSLVPTAAQGSPEPDGAAERWTSWRRLTQPTGLLVFLGRGNSKAYRSLATKPSSIFFLDDRDSYRHLCPTYRCVDSGRYCLDTQVIDHVIPRGPPSDLSPFVWVLPPRGNV
uniref:Uncharacterized protein n=1 Tax=Avena sativa TaxID=4498 RepID=A0ACD6AHD8_AVESA